MAKERGIRIRISPQRVQALQEICEEMLEEFVPANDHQHLLREYMRDLQHKLQTLLRRNQETYMFILTGTESMAFYQLWKTMDISSDKYALLIVDNLLEKMSMAA